MTRVADIGLFEKADNESSVIQRLQLYHTNCLSKSIALRSKRPPVDTNKKSTHTQEVLDNNHSSQLVDVIKRIILMHAIVVMVALAMGSFSAFHEVYLCSRICTCTWALRALGPWSWPA